MLVRADLLPGVRRLLSVADEENAGVRATLEDAGFVQAGVLHDYAMYGDRGGNAVFYELTRAEPETIASPLREAAPSVGPAAPPSAQAGTPSEGVADPS